MNTILVIEDDIDIGNLIEHALTGVGYQVIRAYSGTEAEMRLAGSKPDMILLDLMLPGISGEELIKGIHGIPIIVVSAKSSVSDKVKLLYDGAVDYITKPFDKTELLARVQVHLRLHDQHSGKNHAEVLDYKGLMLNVEKYEVSFAEKEIKLTRTEFAILKCLMMNIGRVMTKNSILEGISGDTPDCTEESLKMHISNVRRKLKEVSGEEYIDSVWGIGFKVG